MAWWFGMALDGRFEIPFEASGEKEAGAKLRLKRGPDFVAKGPCTDKWEAWLNLQTWLRDADGGPTK